jgi:Flp pilus assembly protein TadD
VSWAGRRQPRDFRFCGSAYARVVAAPLDPETTPEEYRQRALLLADLGRYDEAAGEIAAGLSDAPNDPGLLATLARVHLAAEQPAEALVAADRAATAAPHTLPTLVVRAMALSDNQRYGDAAQVATDILRHWPGDAYAQRTGAALLSESRNGQEALNAAWNGVRVAPSEAEAHLVLAVVAARLRLFDLAQRAYAEALDLDLSIGEAQRDMGIVRFERRRWARALEDLADGAVVPEPPVDDDGPYPSPFPRPYQPPDRPDRSEPPAHTSASWTDHPAASGPSGRSGLSRSSGPPGVSGPSEPPAVSRPSRPVLEPSDESNAAVRWAVLTGANATLVAAVVAGLMTLASSGISRTWGGLVGILIVIGVLIALRRRLSEPLASALNRLRAHHRPLAGAAYLGFAAPLLLVVYAPVGGLFPLVAAMVLAAVAETLVLTRR